MARSRRRDLDDQEGRPGRQDQELGVRGWWPSSFETHAKRLRMKAATPHEILKRLRHIRAGSRQRSRLFTSSDFSTAPVRARHIIWNKELRLHAHSWCGVVRA